MAGGTIGGRAGRRTGGGGGGEQICKHETDNGIDNGQQRGEEECTTEYKKNNVGGSTIFLFYSKINPITRIECIRRP